MAIHYPNSTMLPRYGIMISFGNPCNQAVVTSPYWVYLSRLKRILCLTNFKENFTEAALTLFGSGWIWLVLKKNEKRLAVVKTSNAINPIIWDGIPLIILDMWEHSYYLDYKNDKGKYVNVFMNHLVSWNAAMARMARAQAFVNLGEPTIHVA